MSLAAATALFESDSPGIGAGACAVDWRRVVTSPHRQLLPKSRRERDTWLYRSRAAGYFTE